MRDVGPPRVVVEPAETPADGDRRRIELGGGARLGDGGVDAPLRDQQPGVPLARGGVAGVELDRAAEAAVGRVPIPVVQESDPGERGVGLGQRIVELERLVRELPRPRHRLADRHAAVVHVQGVAVRESAVGERVAGSSAMAASKYAIASLSPSARRLFQQ